jgi:hypothetical protein
MRETERSRAAAKTEAERLAVALAMVQRRDELAGARHAGLVNSTGLTWRIDR